MNENLGKLLLALLEKFTWVKVARQQSAFGTPIVTLQVTQIHKGTPFTMSHACTYVELANISDANVIADFMWVGMSKEISKKLGAK